MHLHRSAARCLLAGAALRAVLIVFGRIQDSYFDVNYTDIDYDVFTDAAVFMLHGQSPFQRSTYRYSPLLAALLVPNAWFREWGKVLFACADILAGMLVADLVGFQASPAAQLAAVCLWLFNPYTATISTRGSCDVLVVLMLLAILRCLRDRRLTLAAALYGLAVHFRIYPAIYAPSIALFVWAQELGRLQQVHHKQQPGMAPAPTLLSPIPLLLHCSSVAAATFSALTGAFTWLYGHTYLHESLLYHVTRKDVRHNFSVYYYQMYLAAAPAEPAEPGIQAAGEAVNATTGHLGPGAASSLAAASTPGAASTHGAASPLGTPPASAALLPDLGLLAFMPQLVLLLLFSVCYFRQLPMCWLLLTLAFVAFNKVCTAQYFVWYFCLLPLIAPQLGPPLKRGLVAAAALWMLTQLHWLYWAYRLEFKGEPSFLCIWVASVLFLGANAFLAVQLMASFKPRADFASAAWRSASKMD